MNAIYIPLSPTLFHFAMQAFLESLEMAMPADVKLKYRTNTKAEGKNGGHDSSTDWANQGEFEFSFWASQHADYSALPLS